VLSLKETIQPERYIKAIKVCEESDIEIIIIDSISHEWQKSGCLEITIRWKISDWAKGLLDIILL
jgi:hypothetical protein